jgi:hypothetical protein
MAADEVGADVSALDPKEQAKAARELILAPLRAEHGEVGAFEIPGLGMIVVKAPIFEVFSRFQNRVTADGVDQTSEILELVMGCVVYPDATKARAILKKRPYAMQKISARIRELGGSEVEDLGKE